MEQLSPNLPTPTGQWQNRPDGIGVSVKKLVRARDENRHGWNRDRVAFAKCIRRTGNGFRVLELKAMLQEPHRDRRPGQGGGAIYVTNGRRDYAVVLSPLGAVRLHAWNVGSGNWQR